MGQRNEILQKTDGHCAYCGTELNGRWHVDHVHARYRGGGEETENKLPACARCNLWKKTYTVDEFRAEIHAQQTRLYRDSAAYRLAADFGVVAATGKKPVFYYEKMAHNTESDEYKRGLEDALFRD